MTSDPEPPRLRTLEGELPEALLLALRDSEGDTLTPAELAGVAGRVRVAASERDHEIRLPPFVPRRAAPRGRAASLVLMFSIGAVAGGVVSGGVFVVQRVRWLEVTRSAPASAKPERKTKSQPATPIPPQREAREPLTDALDPPPPRPSREPARSAVQNPAVARSSTPPSAPRIANREELALLARAQSALGSNPGAALALTSDHERKFPYGALVQEREVLAIDALLRLGRRGEAAARAAGFRREFPASVHGRRLDVLLGAGGGAEPSHN